VVRSAGFHRRLVTEVEASWPAGGTGGGSEFAGGAECTLALLESLPRGAFADAYELAGLTRAGGAWRGVAWRGVACGCLACAFCRSRSTHIAVRSRALPRITRLAAPPARVFGAVNVERPAPECAPSVVALLLPANATAGGRFVAAASLPLHARYPAPAPPPAPLARVALPPPRVLLRCGGAESTWRAAELAHDVATAPPLVWEARVARALLLHRVRLACHAHAAVD
jgi:hypothetical protein